MTGKLADFPYSPRGDGDVKPTTFRDVVMSHYDALLQSGWRMNDIDDMDFIGYLDVLLWRARKILSPFL